MQGRCVLLIDTTAIVVEILSDYLDAPVSTEVPAQRPQRLVTVAQDGGNDTPFLMRPRYSMTCWGDSDQDAKGLARACVDALWDAALDHPYLSACTHVSTARDEWTSTGQARYYVTVDLTVNTDE